MILYIRQLLLSGSMKQNGGKIMLDPHSLKKIRRNIGVKLEPYIFAPS